MAYYTADEEEVWAPRILLFYNNRRHHQAAAVGLIGLYLNDPDLIDNAKRYVREVVMFGFRRDGVYGDYSRNTSHTGEPLAQLTLGYALAFGELVEFADALARTGDTSLYDFQSDEGSRSGRRGGRHGCAGQVVSGDGGVLRAARAE